MVITAASGGVGIHAVQIARFLRLTVIAITSSESKKEMLQEAGAHLVVAAPDGKFHRAVREITGGSGADAVIEIAGVPTFAASLRSLTAGGRLVAVGNMKPGDAPLNPALQILKEIEVVRSGHALVSDLSRLVGLVGSKLLQARINQVMPVTDAARAHETLARGTSAGRIVLSHTKDD